ncbi:MAG: hypothetical protein Fur0043_19640 [Anaerolineales bacterium]
MSLPGQEWPLFETLTQLSAESEAARRAWDLVAGIRAEELISAVRRVARGEIFLYPSMAEKLVRDYVRRAGNASLLDPRLSPRKNEILRLLAEDFSSKEIAEKLVVSISTVHTHRNNIMRKLGLSSRRELIQYARRKGMLKEG